jgi:hypothetical protein
MFTRHDVILLEYEKNWNRKHAQGNLNYRILYKQWNAFHFLIAYWLQHLFITPWRKKKKSANWFLNVRRLHTLPAHSLSVAKCTGLSQYDPEAPDFSQIWNMSFSLDAKVLEFQIQYSLKTKKPYPLGLQSKLKMTSQSKWNLTRFKT